MNIPKFQQTQVQGQQANLQAQQILLQQLHQGQGQQQHGGSSGGLNQFPLQDVYGDNVALLGIYQNSYPRSVQQVPLLQNMHQQQYFAQQFLLQQPGQTQGALQYLQQQPAHPQGALQLLLQYQQLQSLVHPLYQHTQSLQLSQQSNLQLQFFNQQALALQQPQGQKFISTNVENPSSVYWQHQQQLCQLSRGESIPHYYARQYAANSRKNKNPYSEVKTVNLIDATRSIVAMLNEQEKLKQASSTPSTNSALLHNKKLAQDIVEDDHLQEEQRMRQKTQGRQLWCLLDLSGQGLVNLSTSLFKYDFLESLYLNNNKLTSIPHQISNLRNLRTLDLSNNRIIEVPPELGMCFNLRYLYLFDNNIKLLPHEFGNLIELLFLGIEGNPMEPKIANIIAEKGTRQLIEYLRDSSPSDAKPEARPWFLLEDDGEIADVGANHKTYADELSSEEESDSFTLMSYNTLCQHYATAKMYRFTPSWALDWNYRRAALQQEILGYKTDIICMQEVETRLYQEFWIPLMLSCGYKGSFFSKTRSKTMSELDSKKVDGCATFYKTDKFELLLKQNFEYNSVCMGSDKYKKTKDLFNRFMNKDNIALITFFNHIKTGEKILVINTHLHWDPAFNDVKALQVGILLEELEGILKKLHHTNSAEDVKNASVVICGDFNSIKDSAVYQLFSTGSSSKHEDMEGRDYGKFTEDGFHHNFKLKSAYDHIGGLPYTTLSPAFTDAIDYIWYSTPALRVKALLGKVDEEYTKYRIGFPDAHFPSDHIPIVTKFHIKKAQQKKKADFKPDFKSGSSRKT